MQFIKRWKEKWGVKSNVQFAIINMVFAVTGSLTVFIRKPIFDLLNLNTDDPFFLRALIYLLTVTPSYLLMLLIIGSIAGQFSFFWEFEKKFFCRFRRGGAS